MRGLARALTALPLLVAAATPPAAQDPLDAAARRLFEVVLPEHRAAEAGGAPLSAARLAWLYGELLGFRGEHPERWPAELDFARVTDEVLARAAASGHDLAPYAAHDWEHSLAFERDQRHDEIGALFERNLARYPETEPHRPLLLYSLAHYARLCGRWEEALERLDEAGAALAILEGSGVDAGELARAARVSIDLERVTVAIELGLFEEAHPALSRAKEGADASGDPSLWGDVVVEELNLALALDDFDGQAQAWARARGDPRFGALSEEQRARLELRRALGRAELERARPDAPWEAQELLERVLAGGRLHGFEARLARLWLADLLLERGEPDEAEAVLGRPAEDAGGLCCDGDLPDRLEVGRVALEARLALVRAARAARAARADGTAEGAQALRAALARTESAFEALLARWRAVRVRDGGLAVQHTRLRLQVTEALVALLAAVHGEAGPARALEQVVRAQAPGSLARELGAPETASEAQVRRELVPPGGGLLVVLAGAARSFAFAVDADATRLFELAPVYRLDPARRALARALAEAVQPGAGAAARARVDELARSLSAVLLPPELRAVVAGWADVAVVGAEGLGYVPFELLPIADGERLGDGRGVSYLPSLPVGLWLVANPRATDARRVTVLAAPDASARGTPPPLPFGPEEERLLTGACAWPVRVLSGEAATLERLRALDGEEDRVLHLVAHGVRTGGAHRPRGLLLAAEGGGTAVLGPDAAERLALPPVVFVTACGAWRGPLRRGDDGRGHLAGALLLAGARTVVVSSAPIDYRESLRAMGAAYGALTRDGQSPARALAVARRGDGLTPWLVHAVGPAWRPLSEPAAGDGAAPPGPAPSALRVEVVAAVAVALTLALVGAALVALRRRREASARRS